MKKSNKTINYTLEDVFFENQKNPRHYTKPKEIEIKNLKIGDEVRLIFILSEVDKELPRAERMWVEIKSIKNNQFTGELLNQPYYITTIQAGDVIDFFDRNIATVVVPAPNFDLEKTGIISKKALEKREINQARQVSEEELIDENDSGWEFYYGDETDEDCEDVRYITLDEVLDIEPLLEDAFTENGHAYIFNENKNVFDKVEEL